MEFPVPEGIYTQAEIRYANRIAEIIFQPGDSLVMTVDINDFDSTIHYKGRGSERANFIALHTRTRGRMNQYTIKTKEAINQPPDLFINDIQKLKNAEIAFLEAHSKNLTPDFKRHWAKYYEYYNYFFMEQYPLVHEMIRKRHFTDTIPDTNYYPVRQMPILLNDSMIDLPPYLLYLSGLYESKLKAAGYSFYVLDTIKMKKFEDSVFKLAYKNMPPASADYFIAQNLYSKIRALPLEKTRPIYNEFVAHFPKSPYLGVIDKQFALVERLLPGQPAPEIEIRLEDGSIKKLSDFRGKVVYLNFWASWCRQCVGEIAHETKMKELMKKQPVEFIYLSLDEDTASEYSLIHKYKIEGTFGTLPAGWKSKEIEDYGVQQLPAYFLIDPDGKFAIQTPATPNQSTTLILQIEKLIK